MAYERAPKLSDLYFGDLKRLEDENRGDIKQHYEIVCFNSGSVETPFLSYFDHRTIFDPSLQLGRSV